MFLAGKLGLFGVRRRLGIFAHWKEIPRTTMTVLRTHGKVEVLAWVRLCLLLAVGLTHVVWV